MKYEIFLPQRKTLFEILFRFFKYQHLFLRVLLQFFDIKLPPTKYFHKNVSYTLPYDYETQNRSTVNDCTTTWTQNIENVVKLRSF